MTQLKLFLFGSPQLEQEGRVVGLRGRKGLALVVYLAVSRQRHQRDTLAALLWPERDQSRARANLRRELSLLNNALARDLLAIDRDSVGFADQADLWLDIEQFRQRLAACKRHGHAAAEVCAACLPLLAEAATLYADDFLAGFSLPDCPDFDEWQFFQTEALRQELSMTLARLVQGYSSQGNFEAATAQARRWLSLDPLHEPAHQQLMRLYAWAGQQSAALRQYQEYVRIFDEEFGLLPSEETVTLYEEIKAKRLRLPPDAVQTVRTQGLSFDLRETASTLPDDVKAPDWKLSGLAAQNINRELIPAAHPSAAPFVARARELTRLYQHLEAMLAGQGRVLFITGEAGRGKTALLREFARQAQERHADVIVAGGNCNAFSGIGDPYLPFREVLELLGGNVEPDRMGGPVGPEQRRRLRALMPYTAQTLAEIGPDLIELFISGQSLLNRIGVNVPQTAGIGQLQRLVERRQGTPADFEQRYLFEQYARVLHQLAGQAPLLITLDDLQWADAGSIGLLFHLGRRLTRSRVMLVGSYRPDEVALGRPDLGTGAANRHPLEKVLAEFKRTFGDIEIDLARAEAIEGRAFVEAYVNTQPNRLDHNFRQNLFQHTGGHALFTVELLRAMQERGDLVRDEEKGWVESSSLDWDTVPVRVEGVIEERVGQLTPELRELLSIASVEGEEFTAEVVARVLQQDERATLRALSQTLSRRHRLVREQDILEVGRQSLSRYRFTHYFFQRYLYDSLSAGERRLYHRDIARTLESIYGDQIDQVVVQLAYHYLQSGDRAQAVEYLLSAGDQTRRAIALEEAARYYRLALEHRADEDQAGRAHILWKLGECLWILGNLTEALEAFEDSYIIFEALGQREGAGAIQRMIGRIYWEKADRQASLNHYRQALAILEGGPESVELARAISGISQMHMLASEFDQAISWGKQALELAERLGAEDVMVHALNNIGCAYLSIGNWEEGEKILEDNRRRAIALEMPHDTGRAYYNLAYFLLYGGHQLRARALFEELERYAVRVHASLYHIGALLHQTELDWLSGQWASALRRRREMIDEYADRVNLGRGILFTSRIFGFIFNDLGRPQDALHELEKGLPTARGFNELQAVIPHLGQLIRAYAMLGSADQTAEIIQEMLEYLDKAAYFEAGSVMPLLHACRWLAGRDETLDDAHSCLARLVRANDQFNSPVSSAALREGRGLIALAEGRATDAVVQFQQALTRWNSQNIVYDQLRTRRSLGEALARSGNAAEARQLFGEAMTRVEALASQLDDESQESFLQSDLVKDIRSGTMGPEE